MSSSSNWVSALGLASIRSPMLPPKSRRGQSKEMWFMVWSTTSQLQWSDDVSSYLWTEAPHLPDLVLARFRFTHSFRFRSKPTEGFLVLRSEWFSARTNPFHSSPPCRIDTKAFFNCLFSNFSSAIFRMP